jgi:hypothetical protein
MRYSIDPPDHIIEIEKKITAFAREAVKNGAALLDEHHPDKENWGAVINPAELLLCQSDVCILGQTYGDYGLGCSTLDISSDGAWEMGFVSPSYTAFFTEDEMTKVIEFEDDTLDVWLKDQPEDQMPWEREPVYYGHLTHAWRELLVSRGYDANGTPAIVLISKERKAL